ncbi:hypothetical protein SOV_33940 [Sporomusa ovata DSM 2662]|nr:hypothetical protein SOV_5c04970 [Sporomusa ovata DSM 2662]
MTLIEALETLKSKGVTKLSGMIGESDIDKYIDHAVQSHEISANLAHIPCHKYHLDMRMTIISLKPMGISSLRHIMALLIWPLMAIMTRKKKCMPTLTNI